MPSHKYAFDNSLLQEMYDLLDEAAPMRPKKPKSPAWKRRITGQAKRGAQIVQRATRTKSAKKGFGSMVRKTLFHGRGSKGERLTPKQRKTVAGLFGV